MSEIIVVHGGVGAKRDLCDGTDAAARAGFSSIGRSVLDAVESAVVVLEDDPRFNAGTGSYMRLDGTIQMDAAIMDSGGFCGSVAAIQRVKNPVKVARKVMETPHVMLAGEGAIRFARKCGFPEYDPSTEKAQKRLEEAKSWLAGEKKMPEWAMKRGWDKFRWCDTVGAVALDANGKMAAATSTGGTSLMMPGRVGDAPVIGCGTYADKYCAISATGIGEEIIRKVLAKSVACKIESGMDVRKACEWGISLFPKDVPVGIIAVTPRGWGAAANEEMACTVIVDGIMENPTIGGGKK